jgi:Protein of unknown function (DUF2911)
MKYLVSFFMYVMVASTSVFAQDALVIPPVDKSPMDMSTYPTNYPLLKIQDKVKEPLLARITYSRPQKNNRVIFGELVEYNTVWRFGANENTEIEFFKDVKINRVLVKKGKYAVFAIPSTDKWTIILNKDLNTWGSFKYDKTKDLMRVDVATQKTTELAEVFYIYFDKTTTGFSLNAGWDDVKVSLPINL